MPCPRPRSGGIGGFFRARFARSRAALALPPRRRLILSRVLCGRIGEKGAFADVGYDGTSASGGGGGGGGLVDSKRGDDGDDAYGNDDGGAGVGGPFTFGVLPDGNALDCQPPEGCDSATPKDSPGRELLIFDDHRAYPAYVVTYTPALAPSAGGDVFLDDDDDYLRGDALPAPPVLHSPNNDVWSFQLLNCGATSPDEY